MAGPAARGFAAAAAARLAAARRALGRCGRVLGSFEKTPGVFCSAFVPPAARAREAGRRGLAVAPAARAAPEGWSGGPLVSPEGVMGGHHRA